MSTTFSYPTVAFLSALPNIFVSNSRPSIISRTPSILLPTSTSTSTSTRPRTRHIKTATTCHLPLPPPSSSTPPSTNTPSPPPPPPPPPVSRRHFFTNTLPALSLTVLSSLTTLTMSPNPAYSARPEGVNRPELLPAEFTTVIDLERFLATGDIRRLRDKIDDLEKRTGFKLRILTQRFPQTPGLAVRDYWAVDDNTVVCVADYFGGSGQLLKFNVGPNVDRLLAPRFWSILSANYGNKFYVSKNGEAASIINAIDAIRYCLLQNGCVTPPKEVTF